MPASDRHNGPPTWTIINTLKWTTAYLDQHQVENPRASSEVMLSYCLNCQRIDLYMRHDLPLQQEELARFRNLIRRRVAGEPVAYIVGRKEFWSLEFQVNKSVLIPRPDTECLIETAIRLFPPHSGLKVLELGCGSGAISIALAHERPKWQFWALDISKEAIRVAYENACRLRMNQRINFLVSDWFAAVGNLKFDLIVTNPPYIRTREIEGLAKEIRWYEPQLALNGGFDGLESLRRIIRSAPCHLAPEGVLLSEIGADQRLAVSEVARACDGYERIEFIKDYGGLDRVAALSLRAAPPMLQNKIRLQKDTGSDT